MKSRIDYFTGSPDARSALGTMQAFVRNKSGLEPSLLDLVDVRTSIINGCVYCIDAHIKDALARG